MSIHISRISFHTEPTINQGTAAMLSSGLHVLLVYR